MIFRAVVGLINLRPVCGGRAATAQDAIVGAVLMLGYLCCMLYSWLFFVYHTVYWRYDYRNSHVRLKTLVLWFSIFFTPSSLVTRKLLMIYQQNIAGKSSITFAEKQ